MFCHMMCNSAYGLSVSACVCVSVVCVCVCVCSVNCANCEKARNSTLMNIYDEHSFNALHAFYMKHATLCR